MIAPASRLLSVFLCAVVMFPISDRTALAQEFGRIEDTRSNVAYFFHAQPGDATIQVSLWGTVSKPGIYEVPVDTRIDVLLSMAGGVPDQARRKGQDPPTTYIRAYRRGDEQPAPGNPANGYQASGREPANGATPSSERDRVFEETLADLLAGDVQPLVLDEDDIIVIETIQPRRGFGWRDALSLASTLGTLTLLGLRIFRAR